MKLVDWSAPWTWVYIALAVIWVAGARIDLSKYLEFPRWWVQLAATLVLGAVYGVTLGIVQHISWLVASSITGCSGAECRLLALPLSVAGTLVLAWWLYRSLRKRQPVEPEPGRPSGDATSPHAIQNLSMWGVFWKRVAELQERDLALMMREGKSLTTLARTKSYVKAISRALRLPPFR